MAFHLDIEARAKGPLFDGTATVIVDDWLEETVDRLANDAWEHMQYWMRVFFRDPTPYYWTQVVVEPVAENRVIHDRGVVYGPWLAGISSRNDNTRFKGYTHWRRTVQFLEQESSPAFLEQEKTRLLRRLDGR